MQIKVLGPDSNDIQVVKIPQVDSVDSTHRNASGHPYLGDANVWTALQEFDGDLKIPSYTKAGLPAAGTAGRVARVSDDVRGEWMDQGSHWFSLSGEVINAKEFGAKGDDDGAGSGTDDTSILQVAHAVGKPVYYPPGHYKVTDELSLSSNAAVYLTPDTTIQQYTADKTIFRATDADNVWIHCNGGVLFGEGTWDPTWTGNSGHDDRGIQLLNCTRSGVTNPVIKNMANTGIYIAGGSRILLWAPIIEGTHNYSTPLSSGDNFQNGIFVQSEATHGAYSDVLIVSPDVSDTNQGILVSAPGAQPGSLNIANPNVHDIRGQHGLYISASNVSVSGPTVDNPALAGIKVQATSTVSLVEAVAIDGPTVRNSGSQAFEFQGLDGGEVRGLTATALNTKDCQRGVTINGLVTKSRIETIDADTTSQHGVLIDGDGVDDVIIGGVASLNAGQNGVLVSATGGGTLRFRDVYIRGPNTSAGTNHGVHIGSTASVDVGIDGLDIDDADGNMVHGLKHSGTICRVSGRVQIKGASSSNVRDDSTIREWPTGADVEHDYYNRGLNMRFAGPVEFARQTTSASDAVVWQQALDDESAYVVRVELVGKLSDSTERAAFVSTVLAYRDAGGGATIQGSADEDVNIQSSGFAGAYSWDVNGTNLRLMANSGGSTTYDWRAKVTVTPLS